MDDTLPTLIGEALSNGPAWALVMFGIWFLVFKLWPFLTETVATFATSAERIATSLKTTSEMQQATAEILAEIALLVARTPQETSSGDLGTRV